VHLNGIKEVNEQKLYIELMVTIALQWEDSRLAYKNMNGVSDFYK